jgi:hypothetical protein
MRNTQRDDLMLNSNPVFVVGMNGSGTTMLLDHLDRHPELFGFPRETKILPHYLTARSRDVDLRDDNEFLKLYGEMGSEYPILIANHGRPVEPPSNWRSLPRTPAAVFDSIMGQFAVRSGKVRWCEKSPMHVQHVSMLARALPNSQFIHVIRDGRDCAASFHRRWGYTPRSTIYRWKRAVREGRSQGASLKPGRYLEVFYERLTAEPVSQLTSVCEFLRIEFVPDMLHAERDASRVKGLSHFEIIENSGRFKTYFTPRQQRALERIAGATLASLGYSTDHADGDYNPPALLRQLWRLSDRIRFALSLVIEKARSPQPFSWRLLTSRFRQSMQQYRAEKF